MEPSPTTIPPPLEPHPSSVVYDYWPDLLPPNPPETTVYQPTEEELDRQQEILSQVRDTPFEEEAAPLYERMVAQSRLALMGTSSLARRECGISRFRSPQLGRPPCMTMAWFQQEGTKRFLVVLVDIHPAKGIALCIAPYYLLQDGKRYCWFGPRAFHQLLDPQLGRENPMMDPHKSLIRPFWCSIRENLRVITHEDLRSIRCHSLEEKRGINLWKVHQKILTNEDPQFMWQPMEFWKSPASRHTFLVVVPVSSSSSQQPGEEYHTLFPLVGKLHPFHTRRHYMRIHPLAIRNKIFPLETHVVVHAIHYDYLEYISSPDASILNYLPLARLHTNIRSWLKETFLPAEDEDDRRPLEERLAIGFQHLSESKFQYSPSLMISSKDLSSLDDAFPPPPEVVSMQRGEEAEREPWLKTMKYVGVFEDDDDGTEDDMQSL